MDKIEGRKHTRAPELQYKASFGSWSVEEIFKVFFFGVEKPFASARSTFAIFLNTKLGAVAVTKC